MASTRDWAEDLAHEIAERYCMRKFIETEVPTIIEMIDRVCPFKRGVMYEPVPSGRKKNGRNSKGRA